MNQKTITKIVAVAFAIVSLAACTKKRPEAFVQGQGGEGLKIVSDYDNKYFDLKTEKAIGQSYSSKAEKVEIENGKGINNFPLVNYTTDAKLLDGVALRGRENFDKYKVLYRLNQTHLVVYKVGDEMDIPIQEQTYAVKLEDGRLAVPMVGYPIKGYIVVENQKTSTGEKSSTLQEMSKDSKEEATHFRIDFNSAEIFKPVHKMDLFPTSFLDGEWYYASTVVKVPDAQSTELGINMSYDSQFEESTRIRFQKFDNMITGVSTNIDERIKEDKDATNSNNVVVIPVEWKAFKVSQRGKSIQMSEEEDETVSWTKRPYMVMDLEGIKSPGTANIAMKARDLKVSDDYFSFAVFDIATKKMTRYSFARVKKTDYQPRSYTKADSKIFGFFKAYKNHLTTADDFSQDDLDQNIRLNRFDPKKEIVYHFTKTSPDWIRPACREIVKNWNEAFRKAGVNTTIRLDDSFDVDIGDIRYNALNMIEAISSSGVFGVGPSLVEPTTGEIISAITNVHVTSIVEETVETVRTYVNREAGLFKGDWFVGGIKIPGLESLTESAEDTKYPQLGYFDNDIPELCPEVVAYAKKVKGTVARNSAEDMAVIRPCGKKLAIPKIQSTLLHEMGHNFGLRHNFRASTDAVNFWSPKVTNTRDVVRSSSTMEYSDFTEDRLVIPGPYDIAAIRYGYADKIEVLDSAGQSSVVAIDTKKSLKAQNLVQKMKPYMFCTDEDTPELEEPGRKTDPLCNRHDKGTNPLEVMSGYIDGYNQVVLKYHYRRGNVMLEGITADRLMAYKERAFLKPMMFIYYKWRDYVAQYVGYDNKYLESYSREQYQQILENMSKDPRFAKVYAAYKPAADRFYQFTKSLILLKPKYCVAQDSTKVAHIFDLAEIRENIFRESGITVNSCLDEAVQSMMSKQGLTFQFGGGFFNQDIRADLSESAANDPIETMGFGADRHKALVLMSQTEVMSKIMIENNFNPVLTNEPQYRYDIVQAVMNRVLEGTPLSDYGIAENKTYKKFGNDIGYSNSDLWAGMYRLAPQSYDIAEKTVYKSLYMRLFSVEEINGINMAEDSRPDDLTVSFADKKFRAHKDNIYGYAMLSKVKYLIELKDKSAEEIQKAGYETANDVNKHLEALVGVLRKEG